MTSSVTQSKQTGTSNTNEFSSGSVLFREGESGSCMYVIKTGKLRVMKRIYESEIEMEVLGPGEFCGELAILGDYPRPVTVVALEDTTVLQIERDQFGEMLSSHTEIAVRMMKRLCQRVTQLQYRVTNLMLRSAHARVVHQLHHEATVHGAMPDSEDHLIPLPANLHNVVAIDAADLYKILADLQSDGLIDLGAEGHFQIPDGDSFERYLRYLELQDAFEFKVK